MSMVYIAINLDLGWDNVIGVFDTYEKAFDACRPTPEELEGEDADFYLNMLRSPDGIYEMHHIHSKEIR